MPLIVNGVEVTKLPKTIQEFLQFTSEKDDQLKVVVGSFYHSLRLTTFNVCIMEMWHLLKGNKRLFSEVVLL